MDGTGLCCPSCCKRPVCVRSAIVATKAMQMGCQNAARKLAAGWLAAERSLTDRPASLPACSQGEQILWPEIGMRGRRVLRLRIASRCNLPPAFRRRTIGPPHEATGRIKPQAVIMPAIQALAHRAPRREPRRLRACRVADLAKVVAASLAVWKRLRTALRLPSVCKRVVSPANALLPILRSSPALGLDSGKVSGRGEIGP
jgi:hypothetical protein